MMTDNHGETANRLRKEWFSERAFQFHNDLPADYERYLSDFRDVLKKQILESAGYDDEDKADAKATTTAEALAASDAVMAAVAMFEARRDANNTFRP
jgi:hypothetical protein